MIAHRASRDITRCRTKYGEAWREYERRVPYLFIPVRTQSNSHQVHCNANLSSSTSSKDARVRPQLSCPCPRGGISVFFGTYFQCREST